MSGEQRQWKSGESAQATWLHTQSCLLAHRTRTPSMYTDINIPMYKCYTGLAGRAQSVPCPATWEDEGWRGAGTGRPGSAGGRGPAPLSSQAPPRGPGPPQYVLPLSAVAQTADLSAGPGTLASSSAPSLCEPCCFTSGPSGLLPAPQRRLGLRCSSAEGLGPLAASLPGAGAKPQPSPGQPCWVRMSAHSWLPARRA